MENKDLKSQDKLYFELSAKSFYESKAKEDKGRNWYVEALVATTDRDSVDDIILPEALERAAKVLKEQYQTVLYNHQSDRPIGKVVDATVKDLGNNRKGLWVKIMISKTEEEIWQKIKEGVLSKFSFWARVARKPVYVTAENGEEVIDHYLITDMYPFECSLVSVPANPNAVALDYYISKHLNEGGITMAEKKEQIIQEETKEVIKDLTENNEEEVKETEKKKEAKGEEELVEELTEEILSVEEKEKKVEEEANQKGNKPKVKINTKDVDYRAWSQVDKIRLARILYESGNKTAIKEAFGVVPDINKRSTWKFPHHVLRNAGENTYELVLSYTGLMAAYKAFRGARRKPKLTEEERRSLKNHLRKHFRYLVSIGEYEEIPEGLKSLAYLIELSFAIEDGNIDIIDEQIDKNFKNTLDRMITEKMEELEKELETEDKTEKEQVENEGETKSVEVDEDTFFKQLREIIREELEEFFESEEFSEEDEELEENKNIEKESEEMEVKVELDEKILKMIEDLNKEIDTLKKEIEELKSQPQVKGMDSQREEGKEVDFSEFIKSEKFEKLPLKKQIEILRVLMGNLPFESKINKLEEILREINEEN